MPLAGLTRQVSIVSAYHWDTARGRKPRFFGLDPDASHLYAANENNDTIVEFAIDQASGKLAPTGQIIETGIPAHIPLSGKTIAFDGNAKCVSGC